MKVRIGEIEASAPVMYDGSAGIPGFATINGVDVNIALVNDRLRVWNKSWAKSQFVIVCESGGCYELGGSKFTVYWDT